jgi:hypothetical protein
MAAAAVLTPQVTRSQPVESLIYNFSGGADGNSPVAGLIADSSGALYGTTQTSNKVGGCTPTCGVVFKLTPPGNGQTTWTETVLYTFTGGKDGGAPGAGLLMDSSGALYGTTQSGGPRLGGTVFKLTPPAQGATVWTETVLYGFNLQNPVGGETPEAGLIADASGALYGTTVVGGSAQLICQGTPYGTGCGTVFKLAPPGNGKSTWTEQVLHKFAGGSDGSNPVAGVVMDTAGALYGTTIAGGSSTYCADGYIGCGTAFKLQPPAQGKTVWTETFLHKFSGGADGAAPYASLVPASGGAFYGTAAESGTSAGVVFELTPPGAKARWTQKILYTFSGPDGEWPNYMSVGAGGVLYGTTEFGGVNPNGLCNPSGCGNVFSLTPPLKGKKAWIEAVLHDFGGPTGDGAAPLSGVIIGANGNLYGTTYEGGANYGTVFEIVP